jgi:hypothetical protein
MINLFRLPARSPAMRDEGRDLIIQISDFLLGHIGFPSTAASGSGL